MPNYPEIMQNVINKVTVEMFGVEQVVRLSLIALFTDGHVLLEGNPGLGKTALVKAFENALGLQMGRIQFTPDLMPSDITGTLMPQRDGSGHLEFSPGPVFTSLLLADEINRATPKTQAAMLEAMAERQVTVLGETHRLDGVEVFHEFRDKGGAPISLADGRPFMVLATQNPVEHEGTYELPEAQSDRFMFKILMPVPHEDTLLRILRKTAGQLAVKESAPQSSSQTSSELGLQQHHKTTVDLYGSLRMDIRAVQPLQSTQKHIGNLFLATNGRETEIDSVDKKAREQLKELCSELQFGFGPRAAIALMNGAKAWTKLFITDIVHADARALAQVALPVLRHRAHLTYEGRSAYRQQHLEAEPNRVIDYYLRDLCLASAPTTATSRDEARLYQGYLESFRVALDTVLNERSC